MQLRDFYDYKNRLMEDLLTSESIVSLIHPNGKVEDPASLAYTQVFPCEYIPETVQGGQTFICFDVDVQGVSNKTFLTPVLYIWVFTHRSNLRLSSRKTIRHLKPFNPPLLSTSTTTTTVESKENQNGCLPLNSGKHP